jgi:hypothetical protein
MSKKGRKVKKLKSRVNVLNYKVELQKEIIHWQRGENVKLRELVRDMWNDGMCDCDEYGVCSEYGVCAKCEYGYPDRMRELGIEVQK